MHTSDHQTCNIVYSFETLTIVRKKTFSRVPESTSRDWKNWPELKIFVEQFLKKWQKNGKNIYNANQLTGFYIKATLALNGLTRSLFAQVLSAPKFKTIGVSKPFESTFWEFERETWDWIYYPHIDSTYQLDVMLWRNFSKSWGKSCWNFTM